MIGSSIASTGGGGRGYGFAGALTLSGLPQIYATLTAHAPPMTDGGAPALSYQWQRDGVPIPGATGASYQPQPADDMAEICCEITATGPRTVSARTAPALVRYAPPQELGLVLDDVFDLGSGPQTVDAGVDFSGEALTFTLLDGAGLSIDPATGVVTVPTDTADPGIRVEVQAANSGGTATSAFHVTVEEPEAGAPVLVYRSGFDVTAIGSTTEDGTPIAFRANPRFVHEPSQTHPDAPVNGAMGYSMQPGDDGWQRHTWLIPIEPGGVYQGVIVRSVSGNGTFEHEVSFADAAGDLIPDAWGAGVNVVAETEYRFVTDPAPANAAYLRIWATIVGIFAPPRHFRWHWIELWDVSESGAAPIYEGPPPVFYAQQAHVGEPTPPIDYGACFGGIVTGYSYSEPGIATFTGTELSITPTETTSGTVENGVFAENTGLQSSTAAPHLVNVAAAPPALSPLDDVPDLAVEAGRPVPPIDPVQHVAGGVAPFQFAAIVLPAWLTMEPFGLVHGYAAETAGPAETVTVRVTDARGDTADVSWTVTPLARRSRVPTTVAGPAQTIRDLVTAASSGDVIHLPEGWAAGWGNAYQMGKFDPRNPVILTAHPSVMLPRHPRCSGLEGVIFEGLHFDMAGNTEANQAFKDAAHLHLYDCVYSGEPVTVDPFDGQSWMNTLTWAYRATNQGVVTCRYGTVDGCTVTGAQTGIYGISGESAVTRTTISGLRDDGGTVTGNRGWVMDRVRIRDFGGNFLTSEHQDLFQGFGEGGSVQRAVISNCFLSAAAPGVQGIHWDHDVWSATPMTPEHTHEHLVFRETVVLGSHPANLFLFERFKDCRVERCVVLNHPDPAQSGSVRQRRSSIVAFEASILHNDPGPGTDGGALTLSGCEVAPADPAAIFPNWGDAGAAWEDPREAVENGAAAETARFWIDPASPWGTANAAVAPDWLRTGDG